MTFELPPEQQDRQVTITIPKDLDPYFKQWYLETRKQGETPESFAYRQLAKAGLAYRKQKVANEEADLFKTLIEEFTMAHDTAVMDSGLD